MDYEKEFWIIESYWRPSATLVENNCNYIIGIIIIPQNTPNTHVSIASQLFIQLSSTLYSFNVRETY